MDVELEQYVLVRSSPAQPGWFFSWPGPGKLERVWVSFVLVCLSFKIASPFTEYERF